MVVPLVFSLEDRRASAGMEGSRQQAAGGATHLEDNTGLLQQVRPHVGSDDVVVSAEADLDVLPKAAAVVVPGGFSVPNGLMGKLVGRKMLD